MKEEEKKLLTEIFGILIKMLENDVKKRIDFVAILTSIEIIIEKFKLKEIFKNKKKSVKQN